MLVPLYGPLGTLVGIQGRRVDGEHPKSVTASGVRKVGLYADATARAILAAGARPEWWRGSLVIVAEGEPDWLTWATKYSDREDVPAVFGFPGGGGWSAEMAARIPSGVVVAARTHDDTQGRRYAEAIARHLRSRCDVRIPRRAA